VNSKGSMKLYGKNPVLERIKCDPASIRELYLQKKVDLSEIVAASKQANLKFESRDKDWFDKNATGHAQGVIAEVEEFKYAPFGEIIDECVKGSVTPVFLDGVTDPQNLGGIIRNLACLGGFSLVLSEHRCAIVNETVLRVANGGENYVKIALVQNIATALAGIKKYNISIAGAVIEGAEDIRTAEIHEPMALVIGSEGKGIRPGVLKCLDKRLFLPMGGAQLSFNAAVATALFCYEIARRR
jgi:23S rRNA (guanosine2251-2'-O)-methyltransferase